MTVTLSRLKRGLSTRRNLLVDFTQVYGAQLIGQALSFVSSLLTARYLRPEGFGVWKSLQLIVQYHQFTTLGTQNGMSREVSYWLGKSDRPKMVKIERTAFGHVFTLPLLVSLVIFLSSFWLDLEGTMARSLRLVSVMMMLSMVAALWHRMFVARLLFGYVTLLQVLRSVMSLLMVILLVPRWQIHGLLGGMILTSAAIVVVGYRLRGGISWDYDLEEAWELIKIGFPIMFVGFLFLLLTTVDRILILRYLSVADLGHYGLALMVGGVATQITGSIGDVLYPRVNELYGKAGSATALRDLAIKPAIVTSLTMPVLIGGTILFLDDVVGWVLPDYVKGVLPAKILMVGITYAGVNILLTINRQKLYAAIQSGAVVLNVAISVMLLRQGYELLAVAMGNCVSLVVYKVGATYVSLKAMSFGGKESLRTIVQLSLPYAYAILFAGIGKIVVANMLQDPLQRLVAKAVVLLIVAIPLLYRFWRVFGSIILTFVRSITKQHVELSR